MNDEIKPSLTQSHQSVQLPLTGYISEHGNGAPYLLWEDQPVTLVLDDVIASGQDRPERDAAAEWLLETLRNRPVSVEELEESAMVDGHAWRAVQRAKEDLG